MANKPTQLRATEERESLYDGEGDILLPLKRVRDQYTKRAQELDEKAYGENLTKIQEATNNYRVMADQVQRLIGILDARDFVEAPALIDQTELIASDIQQRVLETLPEVGDIDSPPNILSVNEARKLFDQSSPLFEEDHIIYMPIGGCSSDSQS